MQRPIASNQQLTSRGTHFCTWVSPTNTEFRTGLLRYKIPFTPSPTLDSVCSSSFLPLLTLWNSPRDVPPDVVSPAHSSPVLLFTQDQGASSSPPSLVLPKDLDTLSLSPSNRNLAPHSAPLPWMNKNHSVTVCPDFRAPPHPAHNAPLPVLHTLCASPGTYAWCI